jgi:hypothetical protein
MSIPAKTVYKTTNWHDHNRALKQRGSLTVWFDPTMVWEAAPTGKRGRQPIYGDAAVQACLTIKVLFGMALRQKTGFVASLLKLAGLDWPRLARVRFQHPEPSPKDPCGQHSLSRLEGATASLDR